MFKTSTRALGALLVLLTTAAAQYGADFTAADFTTWTVGTSGANPITVVSWTPDRIVLRNPNTFAVRAAIQSPIATINPAPCEQTIKLHATVGHSTNHVPGLLSTLEIRDNIILNGSVVGLTAGGTATSNVWQTGLTQQTPAVVYVYATIPAGVTWVCSKPVARQSCGATTAFRSTPTNISADATVGQYNGGGTIVYHWSPAPLNPGLPLGGWHGLATYYVNPTLSWVGVSFSVTSTAANVVIAKAGVWQVFDIGATPSSTSSTGWLHKIP